MNSLQPVAKSNSQKIYLNLMIEWVRTKSTSEMEELQITYNFYHIDGRLLWEGGENYFYDL